MKLFNQFFNSDIKGYKFFSLLFFSFLPISFIFGPSIINLNIILIDLLLIIYSLNKKKWEWIRDGLFKSLIFLYLFLILNSILAYYYKFSFSHEGIIRSLSFIKFILLIFAFKILIPNNYDLNKIIKFWLLIVSIFILDIFFEKIFGRNIIGYTSLDQSRIISFFKDELVVGTFVLCFGSLVFSFFLSKNNNNTEKFLLSILLILIPLTIFITGERANFIKSIFLFSFIIIFIDNNKLFFNKKIILILLCVIITLLFIFNKTSKDKYSEIYTKLFIVENSSPVFIKFKDVKYIAHYDAAIEIFKNYPILGVGNKNFRTECKKEKYLNKNLIHSVERCTTHPHQVHFEILSEQGLIGYVIIFFIILRFIKKKLNYHWKNGQIFYLLNSLNLLLFLIPLLPGGGIFSTFNGSFFWIVFALTNLEYEKK